MIVFLPSQIHGLSKEKPNVFYPIKMKQNCPNFPSARSFCYAIIPCLQSHNFTFLFKQEKKKNLTIHKPINLSGFPVCLFFSSSWKDPRLSILSIHWQLLLIPRELLTMESSKIATHTRDSIIPLHVVKFYRSNFYHNTGTAS